MKTNKSVALLCVCIMVSACSVVQPTSSVKTTPSNKPNTSSIRNEVTTMVKNDKTKLSNQTKVENINNSKNDVLPNSTGGFKFRVLPNSTGGVFKLTSKEGALSNTKFDIIEQLTSQTIIKDAVTDNNGYYNIPDKVFQNLKDKDINLNAKVYLEKSEAIVTDIKANQSQDGRTIIDISVDKVKPNPTPINNDKSDSNEKIKLIAKSIEGNVGKPIELSQYIKTNNVSYGDVIYTSSNPFMLNITIDGRATALSVGKVEVTISLKSEPNNKQVLELNIIPTYSNSGSSAGGNIPSNPLPSKPNSLYAINDGCVGDIKVCGDNIPYAKLDCSIPGSCNDKILFTSIGLDYNETLHAVKADGSEHIKLVYENGIIERQPGYFWSPDKTRLILYIPNEQINYTSIGFNSYTTINLLNLNKQYPQYKLTTSANNPLLYYEDSRDFTFSPDGNKIAFQVNTKSFIDISYLPNNFSEFNKVVDIMLMNTDGTNKIRITNDNTLDYHISWSFDSKQLIFEKNNGKVFIVNSDGSNLKELLPEIAIKHDLQWSPTQKKILFIGRKNEEDNENNIYCYDFEKNAFEKIISSSYDYRIYSTK